MKRLFLILIILILIIPTIVNASTKTYPRSDDNLGVEDDIKVTDSNRESILSTPKVDADEKIYDFADLISDSEEKTIYSKINSYINRTNIDMVIVTINKNDNKTSLEYAKDFYDYNDFGIDRKNDGILLLIDMVNRRTEIITTGSASIYYDDSRLDTIIDSFYDELKDEDYYTAMTIFIQESSDYFSEGIPSSNKGYDVDDNGNLVYVGNPKVVNWTVAISCGVIISGIIIAIMIFSHKKIVLATNASNYMNKTSIKLYGNTDRFLTTFTTKKHIPRNNNSGLGSSGGGSSISRGSSGRSHGGRGRGF